MRGALPPVLVTQVHLKPFFFFFFFRAPRCKISPCSFFFFFFFSQPCATDHYLFWLILESPQDRSCPDSARWYKSNKWLHANKGECGGEELKTIFSSCHIRTMRFIRRINLPCLPASGRASFFKRDVCVLSGHPPRPHTGVMNEIVLKTYSDTLIVWEWRQCHLNWNCIWDRLEGLLLSSFTRHWLWRACIKADVNMLQRKWRHSDFGVGSLLRLVNLCW